MRAYTPRCILTIAHDTSTARIQDWLLPFGAGAAGIERKSLPLHYLGVDQCENTCLEYDPQPGYSEAARLQFHT